MQHLSRTIPALVLVLVMWLLWTFGVAPIARGLEQQRQQQSQTIRMMEGR